MKETANRFLKFLDEEYQYLTKIKTFLTQVPELIPSGNIHDFEFQNFLEKHELETYRFIKEKEFFKQELAEKMSLPVEKINFKLLVNLGFREFETKSKKVLRISNEISLLLMKISIFLTNYSKMQKDFQRLNGFLYQRDYSAKGHTHSYNPGRNFYREA